MSNVHENTPLLHVLSAASPDSFPWLQFSLITFLRALEPFNAHLIDPFSPQLVRDLGITGGNEARVGYYVGILNSVYFLSQAVSSPFLTFVSDRVGRRPIVFACLVGLTGSMLGFGLSKTFWCLILMWSMNGAANGMIALVNSLLIEITDTNTIAQACAYYPAGWQIGTTLAPLIGGLFAQPVERFPWLFGSSKFLQHFPYFLPCAVSALLSATAILLSYLYLQETVENRRPFRRIFSSTKPTSSADEATQPLEGDLDEEERASSVYALITPQILLVAANFASYALLALSSAVVYPLFLSTPMNLGGLGLLPHTIGFILFMNEITVGVLQVLLFKNMHDRWGSKTIFIGGMALVGPALLCLPVMHYVAKAKGFGVALWAVVALRSVFASGLTFCLGAIMTFVAAASPSKASVGVTNGVCQVAVSLVKALSPVLASSLYSLSLERGYLGGYLVYVVLFLLTFVSILIAIPLPK